MNAAMTSPPQSPITSSDRLGMTLFLAIIIHAIIILGITFRPTRLGPEQIKQPPLEIILVQQRSEKVPEDAEYLAQANLKGAGDREQKDHPTSPATIPLTKRAERTQKTAPVISQSVPSSGITKHPAVLTSDRSTVKTRSREIPAKQHKKVAPAPEQRQLNLNIAYLDTDMDPQTRSSSQRLKHRYISASTQEYRDAAYLDAWRAKIERIGNLNYPQAAKRKRLSGNLVLDVALNADGTLHNITITRSSGHKILDDAALHIVKLAAPFAPFPEELRRDTDILHIIRGWQFLDDNRLQTSR